MGDLESQQELAHRGRQGRAAWTEAFEPVLAELRDRIRGRRPEQSAAASGSLWDAKAGEFRLHYLNGQYRVMWPELVVYPLDGAEPGDANLQGLVLYYLALADGTPPAGRWIGFRELPDGWLYHQAFQGYTGDELVRAWGNRIEPLTEAATRLGGWKIDMADAGYAFDVLPRVRIAVVYWLGDDEFPPNAQVLFDASASHYLTTDGLAVLGHRFIHRLLEASG